MKQLFVTVLLNGEKFSRIEPAPMNRKMTDRIVDNKVITTVIFPILLTLLAMVPTTVSGSGLTILYSNDIRGEIEPCG